MSNKTLLKKFTRTLNSAWVGCSFMDITIVFSVFKVHHKFLWKEWDSYEVEKNIPYIRDPFYDGEYNTNRRLEVLADMLNEQVGEFIRECEMNGDEND